MRLPVASDKPGPVHGDHDRQVLKTDIMKRLVIGPLEEGRINGKYRLHPARRQTGCKGHGVLFCDPHVKEPFREILFKCGKSGPVRHGRRNCHDFLVFARDIGKHLGKHLSIAVCAALFRRLAGPDIKGPRTVETGRVLLRRPVAFSFFCDHVYEDGVVHPLRFI